MATRLALLAAASAALLVPPSAARAPQGTTCSPDWLPTFGSLADVDGVVYDAIVYDDGSGPALYVGGDFRTAGGVEVNNVARFDGVRWSSVGDGLDGGTPSSWSSVRAFAVYDDGAGPALYAGGRFVVGQNFDGRGLARWDGTAWQSEGHVSGTVLDLEVYDDGTGPQLYVGGDFSYIPGPQLSVGIARYDGSQWSAVDEGVWVGDVRSLVAYDDGSGAGPSLYVGGVYTGIRDTQNGGTIQRIGITRWNASGWSPLGQGLDPPNPTGAVPGYVLDMTLHDFGSGPELVLAGSLSIAGGAPVENLARWNGSTWSDVGGGVTSSQFTRVTALSSFDDGTGPQLVVGGRFDRAGGSGGFQNLASFRGGTWTSPGDVDWVFGPQVTDLTTVQLASGPRVLLGGAFESVGGAVLPWLAAWDGSAWGSVGAASMTLSGEARAVARFDDGNGERLYVAGLFLGAGGAPHPSVARWNGTAWESVGGGLDDALVEDMLVMETSNGPRLFAGGRDEAGFGSGPPVVWEFDGASWTRLPPLPGAIGSGSQGVLDLEVFAGNAAPMLYAAGDFGEGVGGSHIARWNGSAWDDLAGALYSADAFSTTYGVTSMAVHDDGSGERLFVAGGFQGVVSLPWNDNSWYTAAFDGTSWYPTRGIEGSGEVYVNSIQSVDLGGVQRLLACGRFQVGTTAEEFGIAHWDGQGWVPGPALPTGAGGRQKLGLYDFDGSGPVPVLANEEGASNLTADTTLLLYDGVSWLPFGTATNGQVYALESIDDGTGDGPLLFVGGDFSALGPHRDAFVARFGGCSDRDLGDPYCVAATNSSGSAAVTTAFGSPFVAQNDVTLAASDLPQMSFGYFLASRTQGFVAMLGGSQGNLCLGGTVGRFASQAQNSGAAGAISLGIDLTAIPQPTGAVGVLPGETWSFQAWFRDANPTATSNFSRGLEVTFR